MSDKGELLRSFLEERGVMLSPRLGWQAVSCFNKEAHRRGDRNSSASVNLGTGRYRCHSCDMSGDAYDLLMMVEHIDFRTARDRLGAVATEQDVEAWL